MSVKYKTKTNKLPEIEQSLKSLSGKKVEIGAFNGSHAWLAGIHEYGVNIEVTPKMRAYLHSQGLHLKESTTVIKIPERAFLRNGHDENANDIMTQTERAVSLVIAGKMSVDDMLDMCGQQFATEIKDYMSKTKANHPFTIEQKGSSTPLTGKTGGLVESIDWRIVG